MEYVTTTLGYGFRAYPHMFEDWTGLTKKMIEKDFEDVLTEYSENHQGIVWADFGSNRKSPDDIMYYLMVRDSIRYCDGLIPAQIELPRQSYEKAMRESVHKLNVKEALGWYLGIYEW